MHYTAFVPYSVTAGCSLTGNTHRLLHVLCCLWLPSDPGIFPSDTIVLLGICYHNDPPNTEILQDATRSFSELQQLESTSSWSHLCMHKVYSARNQP